MCAFIGQKWHDSNLLQCDRHDTPINVATIPAALWFPASTTLAEEAAQLCSPNLLVLARWVGHRALGQALHGHVTECRAAQLHWEHQRRPEIAHAQHHVRLIRLGNGQRLGELQAHMTPGYGCG